MFTGLKAVNHFGRPDMSSFLKFVQKKHSYVSFKTITFIIFYYDIINRFSIIFQIKYLISYVTVNFSQYLIKTVDTFKMF